MSEFSALVKRIMGSISQREVKFLSRVIDQVLIFFYFVSFSCMIVNCVYFNDSGQEWNFE